MTPHRRQFMKAAGAGGAAAATARLRLASAAEGAPARGPRGLPKGLTLLTFRKGGALRLGARTDKGVLDVADAAAALRLHAPASLDDLLQQEEGPSLNAVVDAALKDPSLGRAFL